jgi:hypothetical protein
VSSFWICFPSCSLNEARRHILLISYLGCPLFMWYIFADDLFSLGVFVQKLCFKLSSITLLPNRTPCRLGIRYTRNFDLNSATCSIVRGYLVHSRLKES